MAVFVRFACNSFYCIPVKEKILSEIKEAIANGTFPIDYENFGGAGVIITSDPNFKGCDGDKILFTDDAPRISWLISRLKNAYEKNIDFRNKESFYTLMIQAAAHSLEKGDIFDVMDEMVRQSKLWAIDNPEIDKQEEEFDGHGP